MSKVKDDIGMVCLAQAEAIDILKAAFRRERRALRVAVRALTSCSRQRFALHGREQATYALAQIAAIRRPARGKGRRA